LDDRRLLRRLLLPHADGASLLGALEEVVREALLVLDRRPHPRHAHVGRAYRSSGPPETAAESRGSSKGFRSTESTRARSSGPTSLVPERSTTRVGSSRAAISSSSSSPSSA